MFPVLSPTQIGVARRFGGEPRRFERDQIAFALGWTDTPAYLILSGSIIASRRDSVDDWHYRLIADDVLPALSALGVSDSDIDLMVTENPRRIFADAAAKMAALA